jgi:hypothetical protein
MALPLERKSENETLFSSSAAVRPRSLVILDHFRRFARKFLKHSGKPGSDGKLEPHGTPR